MGTWVAQSIKHLTSAQVMISRFVSSSPMSGSVLTDQSLEPASDFVSPPLSAHPMFMLCLSLSLNNEKMLKKRNKKQKKTGPREMSTAYISLEELLLQNLMCAKLPGY